MPQREPQTLEEYKIECDTLQKVVEALMDGKPSGLNVHQARILMGKLEEENKALKETVNLLAKRLMYECGRWERGDTTGRCENYYCDECPLAELPAIPGEKFGNYACTQSKRYSK